MKPIFQEGSTNALQTRIKTRYAVVVVRDHTQIRVILRMVQTESRHTKVTNMANSNFRSNARQSLPKRSQPFFRMDHRLV